MNFFERQDRARRSTGRLLVLFALAVIAIVVAVNAIVLVALGASEGPEAAAYGGGGLIARNAGLLFWTTFLTGAIIGLASLYRSLNLRSGGGTVARELGGTLVESHPADPLRRRLRNVVEEVAIASGVPVPEIYVLDQEPGINAFAAGYSPADAAITVTRGTLENLSRAELQGVVAHEFGHVLNGDMRLNIRLMGVLFGILVMALIGHRMLYAMRFSRSSRNTSGVVVLGIALTLVGYVGLFFGRWIKASVSRQREYLADASAVQFTRNADGLGGALKKIGALEAGSALQADSEEVNHMLFASGFAQQMFSTHPPLIDRIRAIDPGFDPAEFEAIRAGMRRHAEMKSAEQEEPPGAPGGARPGGFALTPEAMIGQIGQAGFGGILAAGALAAAMPGSLAQAARASAHAPEVICYLLLDRDPAIRERQVAMVAEALGAESVAEVRALLRAQPDLARELRIPLLEMAFPALRRRPQSELAGLLALVDRLVRADGRIDVFEYGLGRLLRTHLEDLLHPNRSAPGGRRKLPECAREARDLLSILAHHGHPDAQAARAALDAGLHSIGLAAGGAAADAPGWTERLDAALARLDQLAMPDKQRLVRAMMETITYGGETVLEEVELLRAACASLHVPLPVPGGPD